MRLVEAEFLLIDNSNSFTKFALSTRETLLRTCKLQTQEITRKTLQRAVRGWRFKCVVLSSVVPKKADVITRCFSRFPLIRVSARLDLGVGIDYPKPKTIGADRLANAVSAVAFYGAPVVVVDFGTAVSFDIVSREKNYVGGVIAPGLEAMTEYLHHRTALLPKIHLFEPPRAIGKSTRDAMLAGAVYGYRGLVRQILAEIGRELGMPKRLKVIATGGYAELISRGLPEIHFVRPNLTLEGLRLIGALNRAQSQNGKRSRRRRAEPLTNVARAR
jgi:type III pantothenate kinase